MSLVEAYSLDLKKNITPDEADEQFQNGNIKIKQRFQCSGKNCSAQVTCANLDKKKRSRRRSPYYRVFGEHSPDCNISNTTKTKRRRNQQNDIYSSKDKFIEGTFRIDLRPPSNKTTKSDGEGLANQSPSPANKPPGDQSDNSERKIQPSKRLSSVVDSYSNGESIEMQLPNIGKINIQDLFVEINGQDISKLPKESRIYFGEAWFSKIVKTGDYLVTFKNELISDGVKRKTSFFIPDRDVKESQYDKFNEDIMKEIVNKNLKQEVFLLSEKTPYLKKWKNRTYINIWCRALHFIYYRPPPKNN